jgi:hypothetical protein
MKSDVNVCKSSKVQMGLWALLAILFSFIAGCALGL